MNKYLLIVAGGSGLRMNSDIPKQFMLLNNRPIILHTIDRFLQWDKALNLIVILPQSQFGYWKEMCIEHNFLNEHQLVGGGNNRFESVSNGLAKIDNHGVVLIHDGVRPFVSINTIQNCYNQALLSGAAIPVLDSLESLRYSTEKENHAVDRSFYKTVQTPQVFRTAIILEAYKQPYQPEFTDDASVVEKMGIEIKLVAGNRGNIKITTPIDLKFGEILIANNDF